MKRDEEWLNKQEMTLFFTYFIIMSVLVIISSLGLLYTSVPGFIIGLMLIILTVIVYILYLKRKKAFIRWCSAWLIVLLMPPLVYLVIGVLNGFETIFGPFYGIAIMAVFEWVFLGFPLYWLVRINKSEFWNKTFDK